MGVKCDKKRYIESGMDDYLSKLMDVNKLESAMRKYV